MRLGSPVSVCRRLCFLSIFVAASASVDFSLGQAVPAASGSPPPSRVDLFIGYSYFHPFSSDIAEVPYPAVPLGGVGSVAGYFTRHIGIQVVNLMRGMSYTETGSNLPRHIDNAPLMLIGDDFLRAHRVFIDNQDHLILFSYLGGRVFSTGQSAPSAK